MKTQNLRTYKKSAPLRFASIALLSFIFTATAFASNRIIAGENYRLNPQATYTLTLQCQTTKNAFLMSKLAVLDTHTPEDIAITTGHGLVDSAGNILSDCSVRDFKGHKYKIKSVKVADDYAPGTPTDWAVLTFEKARKTPLVRYALAAPLETQTFDTLAEDRLAVNFSSARGLPGNGQDCAILPRRHAGFDRAKYKGLLPHNCRAVSGQSGAPVSISRDGHAVIMGFHVGHAFLLQSPYNNGPSRYGYMRVFDDHLREHVNAIIVDLTKEEAQ